MGRRGQPRVQGILPVRIWGTNGDGEAFSEHVCTMDISAKGVRLAGVRTRLSVGDTLGIQYRNRKARFRVKWIVIASYKPAQAFIGIECLEPKKKLWPINLPAGGIDFYEDHKPDKDRRRDDRRRHTRFRVAGKACVSRIGAVQGGRAEVRDISLSGCSLQTSMPLYVGHRVTLLINLAETQIESSGVVRASCSHQSVVGIEFTSMSAADRQELAHMIAKFEQSPAHR